MSLKIRFPKPIIVRPLTSEVLGRIRLISQSFKILASTEANQQHVILLFDDIGAGYRIKSRDELDAIINGLVDLQAQVLRDGV